MSRLWGFCVVIPGLTCYAGYAIIKQKSLLNDPNQPPALGALYGKGGFYEKNTVLGVALSLVLTCLASCCGRVISAWDDQTPKTEAASDLQMQI